jgi:hypothetical protein
MKRALIRLSAVAAIVLASQSCGHTAPVAGDWSGRVAPFHFDYLVLHLTQDGKVIRGTACYQSLGSGGPAWNIGFRDVAVTGVFPTVSVVAPTGFTFEGSFDDKGEELNGHWKGQFTDGSYVNLTPGTPGGAAGGC